MANEQSVSDVVAARVRQVRVKRHLTVAELATRCAELGAPKLTAQALYKLEGARNVPGRPARPVTVDELLTLAVALNVAPVHLLVPVDDPEAAYPVIGGVAARRFGVRAWIRGIGPIDPDADPREFGAEVPLGEFYQPTYTDHDGVQIHARQQGPPQTRKEPGNGEHQETS
jgi:transcriptional regulator with XRE-family HTH domain